MHCWFGTAESSERCNSDRSPFGIFEEAVDYRLDPLLSGMVVIAYIVAISIDIRF